MASWSVRVVSEPAVAAGTVVFRHGGALYVTVVVKATFALVPGGVATRIEPLPLERDERSAGALPVLGIEAASDLAPYIPGAGVTFRGHAFAPGGRPATAHSVRLAAYRDGAALFEKTLHVFGAAGKDGARQAFTRMPVTYERAFGGPGTSNPAGSAAPDIVCPDDPARPGGFGPISRHWPERKRLLGASEREKLALAIAELPDAMPWEYYHAAPVDQRIASIAGGEWLVLDGLHATLPRLQTNVPVVAVAARLFEPGPGGESEGKAFELAADSLIVDGDREVLSIVWRGRLRVTGEAALPALVVAAGLEKPGEMIDWAGLRAAALAAAAAEKVVGPATGAELEATAAASAGVASRRPTAAVEETIAARGGEALSALAPFAMAGPKSVVASPNKEATPWGGPPPSIRGAGAGGAVSERRPAVGAVAAGAAAPASVVEMTITGGVDRPSQPVAPFAVAEPQGPVSRSFAGASTPGAPWSGERAAPVPQAATMAMESTLALGGRGAHVAPPPMLAGMAAPSPPPMLAGIAAPSPPEPSPGQSPAQSPGPSPLPGQEPPGALVSPARPPAAAPPASAPRAPLPSRHTAPLKPPPAPRPAPAAKPAPVPLGKDAAGLAARFSAAGVDEGQIRQLVGALRPALPPPEEE